jgi:regulatory protein
VIITAINRNPKRRGRVDVYVDGERAFDIARDAAASRELRPGRPIDRSEIEALVAADARKQALDSAVAMLARRPRSEREIRRRLAKRKFAPALIDTTIEALRRHGFIDDAKFAASWTESRERSSPRGRRLVVQELRTLGVAAPLAHAAAAAVEEPEGAYRIASRRAASLATLDYASFRNRLAGFLQRRGFGWDVTRATVERCWRELGGNAADTDDLREGIG